MGIYKIFTCICPFFKNFVLRKDDLDAQWAYRTQI